jgi:N-acyl-D-amino-acid deacylase
MTAAGFDFLIRDGKVYDGAGGEPFVADIGLKGERIAFIRKRPDFYDGKARNVIEARGLSVAPGFIDTHAHSEFTLLADHRAEGKVSQGVTTEINGNCGLSAAPLYGEAREHRESDLMELGIKERWATLDEYLNILRERRPAVNFATLAGHGNVRASVIGYSDRAPDIGEMLQMQSHLREAVREGAIGLSAGLIYPPGVYAGTEEIVELAKCIKGLIYASHMRSEGDGLIEAIEETVRVGRDSGTPVHVSHIKTGGKDNWSKIDRAISVIEKARDEGIHVTCDRYPYTAASTDLDAVLPSWTYAGGSDEELRRLKDPGVRSRIKDEILSKHPEADYWESIAIASVITRANKWMEGKTLSFISDALKESPADLLIDILISEKLRIGAIFHSMNEENLRRFLSLPYVMVGSDSSARSAGGPTYTGKPHPRSYGTFPRFVGRYARDLRLLRIGEAVHKITMLPAETFGLKERGQVKQGFFADLVIFDEDRLADRATFEEPFLKPEGIPYVFVNGTPVVREGSATGLAPGRILLNGK